MALTTAKYQALADHLAQGRVDFDTDTIKVLLMDEDYTPDVAAHVYLDDVLAAGSQAVGTGYAAGGATVTSVTWAFSTGSWRFNGTIAPWDTTGGSLAAAYAIFYVDTGTPSTSALIGYWDLDGTGTNQTSSNGEFALTPDSAGIVTAA